jgi:pyrimidine-nucleoside phosphorylase
MQYNPVELIIKKRDGMVLTESEISFFIAAYLKDQIPEYQMAAFLMCFYFQGALPEEISALTKSYIESGERLHFDQGLLVADKHSTGGVGDKISLMLAPIAAALGLYVPMISGRGLGHTGGTLDKLEAIPGFNTQYSMEDFKALVLKHGYALVGQSRRWCLPISASMPSGCYGNCGISRFDYCQHYEQEDCRGRKISGD